MSARGNNDTSAVSIIDDVTHDRQVICFEGESLCEELVLIYEPYMSYNVYSITVDMHIEDEEDHFVGDVLFTVGHAYSLFFSIATLPKSLAHCVFPYFHLSRCVYQLALVFGCVCVLEVLFEKDRSRR